MNSDFTVIVLWALGAALMYYDFMRPTGWGKLTCLCLSLAWPVMMVGFVLCEISTKDDR